MSAQQEAPIYLVSIGREVGVHPEPITDEIAAELLSKHEPKLASMNFQWIQVERPPHGQMLLTQLNNAVTLPKDGYVWQDQERRDRVTTANGIELEIGARIQGASPGEQYVSMTKKRYRLANGSLTLIHYLAYNKQAPKIAMHPAVSSQHTVSMMPRLNPAAQASLTLKRQQQIKKNVQVLQAREADDHDGFSGDELDRLTARDLASIRYKRNHEYMADILSPETSKDVLSAYESHHDLSRKDELAAEFKHKRQTIDQQIEASKAEHETIVKQFKDSSRRMHSHIQDLAKATTMEEILAIEQAVESEVGRKVVAWAPIQKVQ